MPTVDWEDDDREDDDEGPQECDLAEDDDDATVPCSSCRRDVSELAERCPYCGEWLVAGPATPHRGRIGAALLILAAAAMALLMMRAM
ncbi:MAG: hypothetical protein HRF50_18300 [Phycisphaerae bacterium]|jgi:hypothetical protein